MILILLAVAFQVAIAFANPPQHFELSKDDLNQFVDECLDIEKRINRCKTVAETELLMAGELIPMRDKYRKIIYPRLFKDRMGYLYSHGYNHINKKRK